MDTPDPSLTKIRYAKRAVDDDAWISAFLQRAPFGVLATEWQGQPFAKPTTFVYDPGHQAIYFHGALEGRTLQNLEANPRVCFNVSQMDACGRRIPPWDSGWNMPQ